MQERNGIIFITSNDCGGMVLRGPGRSLEILALARINVRIQECFHSNCNLCVGNTFTVHTEPSLVPISESPMPVPAIKPMGGKPQGGVLSPFLFTGH